MRLPISFEEFGVAIYKIREPMVGIDWFIKPKHSKHAEARRKRAKARINKRKKKRK